ILCPDNFQRVKEPVSPARTNHSNFLSQFGLFQKRWFLGGREFPFWAHTETCGTATRLHLQSGTIAPKCFDLCSGSTWIVTLASSKRSVKAFSIQSHISWAWNTVVSPGTIRWKSINIAAPAWRVRRSCACIAPPNCDAITLRIVFNVCSETASSIRPLKESLTIFEPDQRMLTATRAASAGSSIDHPVVTARMTPIATPTEVTTSVIKCFPSATKAGDFCARPRVISTHAHRPFMTVAAMFTRSPSTGASRVMGSMKPVSYTHLRAHETDSYLVCRLLLE